MMSSILFYVVMILVMFILFTVIFLVLSFGRIYKSIKALPPTQRQFAIIEEEGLYKNLLLFKIIPNLHKKIAWKNLGEFPTPVQKMRIKHPRSQKFVEFWIKRESLSSPQYGGNKVRTLEFQLPCSAATIHTKKKGASAMVYAVGGGGSNQCVASSVFGKNLGIPVGNLLIGPEEVHFDNTLNLLSVLSIPVSVSVLWTKKLLAVSTLIRTIFFSNDIIMPPGGANPTGALGHVGAALELAEQIEQGLLPSPSCIFLAMGSTCTTSGLIVGIALARKIGIGFNKKPLKDFQLHAVIIHHLVARVPFLVRRLMIKRLVKDTAMLIKDMGGPDVVADSLEVMNQLVLHTKYAVKYGAMTPAALEAKGVFSEGNWVHPTEGKLSTKPWLCACFTGKAAACLLDFLHDHPDKADTTIFWDTKSIVQPFVEVDLGWEKAKELMKSDPQLQSWIYDSGIKSGPEDYKEFITKV